VFDKVAASLVQNSLPVLEVAAPADNWGTGFTAIIETIPRNSVSVVLSQGFALATVGTFFA